MMKYWGKQKQERKSIWGWKTEKGSEIWDDTTAVTKEHDGGTTSKNKHILRNHKNKEVMGEEKYMRVSEWENWEWV